MDIPTKWEGEFFDSNFMKLFWVFFQPLFYILRPLFAKPKPFSRWELFNWVIVFGFDFALVFFFGWKPITYLLCGSLLGSLSSHLHSSFPTSQQ
jgi:sphingolipid delta-4 desaturase